ncbi:MAG TPA: SDR family NAD(P)-dependent oxidoreductase, partial [Nitriliruptorales bacterium]
MDRRVLVTGAGSGIGRASAVRAAAEGARVAVSDVRADLAEEAAAQIRSAGGEALAIACDVAEEVQVAEAVGLVASELGGLDGVVASAGIVTGGRTHELTLDDWELVLRVNLTGVFLTLKHALPALVEAGGGSIVTIGSVSSVVIGAGGSAASYKAAKGGVLQLTRAVAVEYAGDGVRANCVCPGLVATNIAEHARELASRTTTPLSPAPPIKMRPPLDRAADPSEIAGVVAFLLSDDASF